MNFSLLFEPKILPLDYHKLKSILLKNPLRLKDVPEVQLDFDLGNLYLDCIETYWTVNKDKMYDLQKLALPQIFLTRFPNAPDTQINRICKLNSTFIKKFPLTAERALILIQKNYREFKNIKIVPNPTYQITKKNLLKKIEISKILNSEEFQN